MGTTFRETLIRKFNELRLFTGIVTLSGLCYIQNLLEITLPIGGRLTTLGTECLYGSRLPMPLLIIPEGVTTINNHAIGRNNCFIENVDLPSTLARFDLWCFYQMPVLSKVRLYAETPPVVASNTLSGIPSRVQFYVPDAALETYQNDASWGTYSSRIHKMSEYPG